MATRAPSAASASAVASPMPDEAPVTNATFPLSLPVRMILLRVFDAFVPSTPDLVVEQFID